MDTTDTEARERPTLAAEIVRAPHARPGYWSDYQTHQGLQPSSAACAVAAEITGADLDTAEHTAVWLVLVLATHPGGSLLGKVGSRVSMGRYLASATAGGPAVGVTSRFKELHRAVEHEFPDQDRVVQVLADLLRVGAKHVAPAGRPDPGLLCGDTRDLLCGGDRARQRLRTWHRASIAAGLR